LFHVELRELRQFPHVVHSFNMSEMELNTKLLAPWSEGQRVLIGEREWEPKRTKLTVIEARELRLDELGMGRGWANAIRYGDDVTDRVIVAASGQSKSNALIEGSDALTAFKAVVRAQCDAAPLAIHQAVWLACSKYPEWRVSQRIALTERAVWELLHEGHLKIVRRTAGAAGDAVVEATKEEWEPALLTWANWMESDTPRWQLVATR
jgi:hypothetical protein